MIIIMEKGREARTGGHRRQVRGDPLRQVGAPVGQGTTGVASVANEIEAVNLGEGVIDEETAQIGDSLNGAMAIGPGATVNWMKEVKMSRGTIHGKLPVGWAHSSGPHWPQEEMGSSEVRGLLPLPDR